MKAIGTRQSGCRLLQSVLLSTEQGLVHPSLPASKCICLREIDGPQSVHLTLVEPISDVLALLNYGSGADGDGLGKSGGRALVLLFVVLSRHAHGDEGPHVRREGRTRRASLLLTSSARCCSATSAQMGQLLHCLSRNKEACGRPRRRPWPDTS